MNYKFSSVTLKQYSIFPMEANLVSKPKEDIEQSQKCHCQDEVFPVYTFIFIFYHTCIIHDPWDK